MAIENVELYEFLKERECHLFKENDEIKAFVIIPFYLMDEFSDVIGYTYFDDGGLNIIMFDNCVSIELNDIFEMECEFIYEYRKCFEDGEFNRYKDELFNIFQDKNLSLLENSM